MTGPWSRAHGQQIEPTSFPVIGCYLDGYLWFGQRDVDLRTEVTTRRLANDVIVRLEAGGFVEMNFRDCPEGAVNLTMSDLYEDEHLSAPMFQTLLMNAFFYCLWDAHEALDNTYSRLRRAPRSQMVVNWNGQRHPLGSEIMGGPVDEPARAQGLTGRALPVPTLERALDMLDEVLAESEVLTVVNLVSEGRTAADNRETATAVALAWAASEGLARRRTRREISNSASKKKAEKVIDALESASLLTGSMAGLAGQLHECRRWRNEYLHSLKTPALVSSWTSTQVARAMLALEMSWPAPNSWASHPGYR